MDFMRGHFLYFRIGDLLIVNETLKNEVETQAQGLSNIVYMSQNGSRIEESLIHPHSMAVLYAITTLNLDGQNVLELGSADGILSVVSKKLGARYVVAVDKDNEWRTLFESHINTNGIPNTSHSFVVADIEKESPQTYLDNGPIHVVYSTLGPAYGDAEWASIRALDFLPDVHNFILAGYRTESGDTSAEKRIALLNEKGFEVTDKVIFRESNLTGISYVLQRA